MAKRFIDTGLFDDEWFSELSINGKLLWIYYVTKCDHAGLMKYNKKLIEFQTGIKSLETVIKELGNRLVRVSETMLFCPAYIRFQYPEFPNSKVKQQESAVQLLVKNGINPETLTTIDVFNSSLTVNEVLPNTYVNDNVNDNEVKGGVGEKQKPTIPTREEFLKYGIEVTGNKDYTFSILAKYDQWLADGWKDGHGAKIQNWKTKLKNTIPYLKQMKQQPEEKPFTRRMLP